MKHHLRHRRHRLCRCQSNLWYRLIRRHRLVLGAGPALLDERFASTDEGRIALGASLSYSYDNRVSYVFPIEGRRWYVTADGGWMPNSEQWWCAARAGATGLLPLPPRHVLPGNASVGLARRHGGHPLPPRGSSIRGPDRPAAQLARRPPSNPQEPGDVVR